MSGVPPYYSLTRGHVSCWPGTESHGQVWAQINAKVWEMYMYISSFPALSYHYKIQHLSLILLAKLLLFFLPFFSLLSSIFLARISLIRSKNTWKKKKEGLCFLCLLSVTKPTPTQPGDDYIIKSNVPCPHWHGFWQKSPHSTRPTVRRVPLLRLRWPAAGRPSRTCSRPRERARFRPPSLSKSALCEAANVIQTWIIRTDLLLAKVCNEWGMKGRKYSRL